MILSLLMSTGIAFADNPNTDDDAAESDGAYTFTTDGEKYGYESYLIANYDNRNDIVYVGARLYDVTLKEAGKLIAEVDSSQINHMTIEICSENRIEKEFYAADGAKGSVESEALPAGTYTVIFRFTLQPNSIIPYDEDTGEKLYFRHYITWNKAPVVEAQSVAISSTAERIEKGGYLYLTAGVNPENAYFRNITWSSSDSNIAEVYDGRVYAKAEGTATIYATSNDGITKSSCVVTVTKTEEEIKEEAEAAERAGEDAAADEKAGEETSAGEEAQAEEQTETAAEEEAQAEAAAEAAAAVKSKTDKAKKLTVKNVKAKALKGKKAKVSWSKKSAASGYQVQYSTNKSFKKAATKSVKVKGASKKTVTIKSLKAKKTYYVRVRTYKNIKNTNGKTVKVYGKWSKVVKVKAMK